MCEVAGVDRPSSLTSINNLARVLSHQGSFEQVEEMYRQALRLRDVVLGKEHPGILTSMNDLANMSSDTDQPASAEPDIGIVDGHQ